MTPVVGRQAVTSLLAPGGTVVLVLRTWGLLAAFVAIDAVNLANWLAIDAFGGNVQIYQPAAALWLTGGDPWAQPYAVTFADPQWLIAPPLALAPYLLTVWLPVSAATWVWITASALAAGAVVRHLHLPSWWLLCPLLIPFWGSADVIFLAILLRGPGWLGAAGRITFAPALIAERRWLHAAVALGLSGASVILTPFLSHIAEFPGRAVAQSGGGMSAWGAPLMMAATLVALILLGWRRGWYLAVPGLWPGSQAGYAMVAMPVLATMPLVAVGVSSHIPLAGPVAIIATALWLRRVRGSR